MIKFILQGTKRITWKTLPGMKIVEDVHRYILYDHTYYVVYALLHEELQFLSFLTKKELD
jgi:hypothetical protein